MAVLQYLGYMGVTANEDVRAVFLDEGKGVVVVQEASGVVCPVASSLQSYVGDYDFKSFAIKELEWRKYFS